MCGNTIYKFVLIEMCMYCRCVGISYVILCLCMHACVVFSVERPFKLVCYLWEDHIYRRSINNIEIIFKMIIDAKLCFRHLVSICIPNDFIISRANLEVAKEQLLQLESLKEPVDRGKSLSRCGCLRATNMEKCSQIFMARGLESS